MAIAQTAWATQAAENADGNPITMAFDCNGGNLLVLSLPQRSAFSDGRLRNAGAPTYNAVAMTDSGEGGVSSGSEGLAELWYLVSPAAGSNTLSVPTANNDNAIKIIASAWSGVDTADPLDVADSDFLATPGDNTPTVTFITGAAGKLIIDAMASGHSFAAVANSHTLITKTDNGSWNSGVQYTLDDGSAGITLDWTVGIDDWAMIVCAFNPSGVPPAGDIESVSGVVWATDIESIATVAKNVIQAVAGVDGI